MYDVIIIGHGPAGLSTALFTARAQLNTLVIGNAKNSQLHWAKDIRNYFGHLSIDGTELLKIGIKQAKKCGAELKKGEVVNITKGKNFTVKTAKGEKYTTKTIVIATGIPIQWSGIPKERELLGKGVHTCPSCDGPMYHNKKVAVIGNANHAAENAIELTSYTKNITIISHERKFSFDAKYKTALSKRKITLKNEHVNDLTADKFLNGVKYADGEHEKFDGIFLACGSAGSLDFATKLGIEIKDNLLVVDANNMTSVPGVFAAGNCMGTCKQIAKNVGDGCNAGVNVIKYIQQKDIYVDYAKH